MVAPERRTGYRVIQVIEDKSLVVGGGALVLAAFVPALAPVAIGVAAWEGAQVVGAEVYKQNAKQKVVFDASRRNASQN